MNSRNPDAVSKPPRFPVETWQSIFLHLTRPGELYHASLISRYIHNIVNPILYKQLCIDPNHYFTYTLSLLKREPGLARRTTELTLLPPVSRVIPANIRAESDGLYKTLDIPYAPIPPLFLLTQAWSPLGVQALSHHEDVEMCSRPILHFFPSFTSLTTLYVLKDCLPSDFFHWIFELPQLTTLSIWDSVVSAALERKTPPSPLPLRDLSIIRCWTKADLSESYIPGILCEALLGHSPFLTSLTIDAFVERAAWNVLKALEHPPPIQNLSCSGVSYQDPDCVLLSNVLCTLPTLITLNMARTPRELGVVLPTESLQSLTRLTGQIKTAPVFFGAGRPLQYLTLTDMPTPHGVATPWDTQLIRFFESIRRDDTDLKGLAFHMAGWSEEVFLCVCELWPGLKELKMQCSSGPGVDEYFRISFGPRFLPRLQNLEVLHIYQKTIHYSFTTCHMSRGVPVFLRYPLVLPAKEAEELAEAPIHYRRWEKICPSLREVAFDRETWWCRVASEPGGWLLKRDVIPALPLE